MADLTVAHQALLPADSIKIFDRQPLRIEPELMTAVAGHEPQAGQFAKVLESTSAPAQPLAATQPLPRSNPTPPSINSTSEGGRQLPTPMQEARRAGGVLRVQDAKELSAVLQRFQKSQDARWKAMIGLVDGNPNLTLAPSITRQLEKKRDRFNRQIEQIGQNFGLNYGTGSAFVQSLGVTTTELSKPIKSFFNFIARGERQLYSLQDEIEQVYKSGNNGINPAVLLKLQLKMTHVSQQLELFTSMLNKGLESSKTVFNTQI